MKTIRFLLSLVLITTCFGAFAQPAVIPGTFSYKSINVTKYLGVPNDTLPKASMASWQTYLPNIVIIDDSVLYAWSVSQQRYIIPKTSTSASVDWPSIVGTNPKSNPYLGTLFDQKQDALPSGASTSYIGGDFALHNLDSLLSAHGWVNKTDTVFTNVQSGSLDALTFGNGLYKTGNNVYAHYEQPIWNANRIQNFFIEANTHPGNGYFLMIDSAAGVARWARPDSVLGAGTTPTFQQVLTESNVNNVRAYFNSISDPANKYARIDSSTLYFSNGSVFTSINTGFMSMNNGSGYSSSLNSTGVSGSAPSSVSWAAGSSWVSHTNANGTTRLAGNELQIANAATSGFTTSIRTAATNTHTYYLPNTGNIYDTIVTSADLRGVSFTEADPLSWHLNGTSTLGSNTTIFPNGHNLTIDQQGNSDIQIKNTYGGTYRGFSLGTSTFTIQHSDATYSDEEDISPSNHTTSVSRVDNTYSTSIQQQYSSVGFNAIDNSSSTYDNTSFAVGYNHVFSFTSTTGFSSNPTGINFMFRGWLPDGSATDSVLVVHGDGTGNHNIFKVAASSFGGGSSSTPGIDDVLAANQQMTTDRQLLLGNHQLDIFGNGHPVMSFKPSGFINSYYYGYPTGAFHMNTGTFNGVAAYWNTTGDFIEKAAGATNIVSKTFANNGNEVYPFEGTVKVDATSGSTTLILGDPADGGFNTGAKMVFIKTDASANTVTVDAWTNWSATLNGVHTKTLTAQWQYIVVQSDGTNWFVVGGN